MSQDLTLTVDYHDRNCVIRRLDNPIRREQVFPAFTMAPLRD